VLYTAALKYIIAEASYNCIEYIYIKFYVIGL